MVFKLIEKTKSTEVQLFLKENADEKTKLYLKLKGFDIENPIKQNSKFIYYKSDKDILNNKR